MTENSPRLMSDTNPQMLEAQNTKQDKLGWGEGIEGENKNLQKIKDKEKNLEKSQTGGKKNLTYKGLKIRIASNTSSETMEIRREWSEIFSVKKNKTH